MSAPHQDDAEEIEAAAVPETEHVQESDGRELVVDEAGPESDVTGLEADAAPETDATESDADGASDVDSSSEVTAARSVGQAPDVDSSSEATPVRNVGQASDVDSSSEASSSPSSSPALTLDADLADFEADPAEALGDLLRERMHQAVATLEPRAGTLDYLHRAVPARRKRRQAALATTAVTVFAVSAGVTLAARSAITGPSNSDAGGRDVGNSVTSNGNNEPGGGSSHGPAVSGATTLSAGQPANPPSPASTPSAPQSSKTGGFSTPPLTSFTGTQTPQPCLNSSVSAVSVSQNVVGGITYETMTATAQSACMLAGAPPLVVFDAAGAPAKVALNKADLSIAPQLANIPAGRTLILQPGDKFQFQFAWVTTPCPPPPTPSTAPSSSQPNPTQTPVTTTPPAPPPSTSTPGGGGGGSSSPSTTPSAPAMPTAFSVAYSVYGSQPAQTVNLAATCGAALYVTDYFAPSEAPHAATVPSPSPTP